MISAFMLSVNYAERCVLFVVMLNVIMLNVVILSVVMLNVLAPSQHLKIGYVAEALSTRASVECE
jgi:hypothetical protein